MEEEKWERQICNKLISGKKVVRGLELERMLEFFL